MFFCDCRDSSGIGTATYFGNTVVQEIAMHLPSFPANVLTNAASQLLTGGATRASSALKSFESDLSSGDIGGAQSFLSTLQQKLSLGSSGSSSAISAQIAQVGSDLKSGSLTAAKADYAQLRQAISQLDESGAQSQSANGTSEGSSASLAALAGFNALQQGAYSNALNLSLPSSMPSLSVSF
jgi:hypothetical protein